MIRAVLGGSFDPVHNGHVALAKRVLATKLAHHVHLIPAARNPHKTQSLASANQRLEMVHLAFTNWPQLTVESLELSRPGPSFSVDTLEALAGKFPVDTWRLLMGADNLLNFHSWHHADRILELVQLVAFSRTDQADSNHESAGKDIPADRILWVPDFHVQVSSTQIRAMVAEGKPVGDLVPEVVANYIAAHQLYRS